MENFVRIVLADKYDLVVGDTFQMFYRSVIEAPNPYCYSIVAQCAKGKNYPRYFEFTPEDAGTYLLKISVYDATHTMLGTAETILNVVKPIQTDKTANILCIGASDAANGFWVSEVHRRVTKTDGEPVGIGCPNINFVGNCRRTEPGRNEVGFEAFGGWTWHRFTTEAVGAMWVKVDNRRTQEDQHSLWKDENGAIWQLETLQSDYLKFNRFQDHDSPRPESGFLTHYADAVDTSPIPIAQSSTEKASPFLDLETRKIDFKSYMKRSNIDTIDAVYINLGMNGLVRPQALNNTMAEYFKFVVSEAKVLVDAMHRDMPNTKIKVLSPYLPSITGGCAASYGARMPYSNVFGLIHAEMELKIAYQAWANEPAYKDFLEFVDTGAQFDAENNYPVVQKPVNTRSEVTETVATNGLHPTRYGYLQYGDAIYRNVVKEFCSEEAK